MGKKKDIYGNLSEAEESFLHRKDLRDVQDDSTQYYHCAMPARKQYAANGASVRFSVAKYAVRNFTER